MVTSNVASVNGSASAFAFLKRDDSAEVLVDRERRRFAQEITIDVDPDDRIVLLRTGCEPPRDGAGPRADLENCLARRELAVVNERAEHAPVARGARAGFQEGDGAEKRSSERDRRVARAKCRDDRVPL
jgi:hypothetical protein